MTARVDHVADGRRPVERHGYDTLLEASAWHPFVRFELSPNRAGTWWQAPGAVAFRRESVRHGPSYVLLGDDHGVGTLLEHLPVLERHERTVSGRRGSVSVTLPQHLEPQLRHWRVGAGGDWEWLATEAVPPASVGGGRSDAAVPFDHVVPLDDVGRRDEVAAFLAEHSPTADAAPGAGEQWFAIETPTGTLAAVAACGRTPAGAPHLVSVAVDGALRGRGLGREIVGALTRRAVLEHGVCTLALYSTNGAARHLYLSLGYGNVCAWASRAVHLTGP
ncbi:MAG: GNAT family N-acetyltransferase [Terracoccus sp.]